MRIDRDQIGSSIILAALVAVFVFGLWMPVRNKRNRVLEQIKIMEQKLRAEEAAVVNLKHLLAQENQLVQSTSRAQKHVPREIQLASLLSQINEQFVKLELTEAKSVQNKVIQGTDYEITPLTLLTKGSFPSIFSFIEQIESMNRLVRINSVEMNRVDREDGSIEVHVVLDAFSLATRESENE